MKSFDIPGNDASCLPNFNNARKEGRKKAGAGSHHPRRGIDAKNQEEWRINSLLALHGRMEETSRFQHPLPDEVWIQAIKEVQQRIRSRGYPLFQDVARGIADRIRFLDPIMDSLCAQTFPQCRESCCHAQKVFFNQADLIYLVALNERVPEGQTRISWRRPCRYLTQRGCRLERVHRPYICTWFLCEPQVRLLATGPLRTQEIVHEALDAIRRRRIYLELLFENAPFMTGMDS